MQYLKIPKERVAVLIGEGGKTKRYIEKRTNTTIVIEDGTIMVDSDPENSINEWVSKDIVLAIGRGFSPAIALKLLKENNVLEVLQLRDFVNTKKSAIRVKGRIIGKEGRTRRYIEQITGCYMSVYGKTVALIGAYDEVYIAKEAIGMLLNGSPHSTVNKFLERKKQEQMEDRRRAMAW